MNNLLKDHRAVLQYVRTLKGVNGERTDKKRPRGRPVGLVIVWQANNGRLKVGYSKQNRVDRWDRDEGLKTALRRAVFVDDEDAVDDLLQKAPTGLPAVILRTIRQARRYFTRSDS